MKITAIKRSERSGRYLVFVDSKLALSLSEKALLDSKLVNGRVIDKARYREVSRLAAEDKLYSLSLRYASIRSRSEWEVKTYLKRKNASPALIKKILSRLRNLNLVNDLTYTENFINNRMRLRPASKLKVSSQLRQKHIAQDVINRALSDSSGTEQAALADIIKRKRVQKRYQDDLKLMRYLTSQGFNYEDIKSAIKRANPD